MLPLLAVLAITMAKDGYEDIKRHQSDRFINRLKCQRPYRRRLKESDVMEAKSRSASSLLSSIKDKLSAVRRSSPPTPERDGRQGRGCCRRGPRRTLSRNPSRPCRRALVRYCARSAPRYSCSRARPTSLLDPRSNLADALPSTVTSIPIRASRRRPRQVQRPPSHRLTRSMPTTPRKLLNWQNTSWRTLLLATLSTSPTTGNPSRYHHLRYQRGGNGCFIETKNLDGETNLKARHAVPELTVTPAPEECVVRALRSVSMPNPRTHHMYPTQRSVVLNERFDKDGHPLHCPVTLTQVLLRGCNLRNTKWVIGVVVMTVGHQDNRNSGMRQASVPWSRSR